MVFSSKTLALGLLIPAAFGAYEQCPNGISTVTVSNEVDVYPVYISQYFDQDTTLIINGGITIDITNAPVIIDTVTSATVTQTVTVTSSDDSIQTANPPGPTSTSFAIDIRPLGLAKRQDIPAACNDTTDFVNENGFTTSDRASAALFFIQDGQLISVASRRPISTDTSLADAPFAASPVIGSITQTWAISPSDGSLTWTNSLFPNGEARFFTRGRDNTLFFGFLPDATIDSTEVSLFAVNPFVNSSSADCPASVTSSTITGSETSATDSVTDSATDSATDSGAISSTESGTELTTSTEIISSTITATPSFTNSSSEIISSTESSTSSTPSVDTCLAPEAECDGVEDSTTSDFATTIPDLSSQVDDLTNTVSSIDNTTDTSGLVDTVEGLATSFADGADQLNNATPLEAGCPADNIVSQNGLLLDSVSSMLDAFQSQAQLIQSLPSLTNETDLGLALDDLTDAFDTFEDAVTAVAPSHECFIQDSLPAVQESFDSVNDAI